MRFETIPSFRAALVRAAVAPLPLRHHAVPLAPPGHKGAGGHGHHPPPAAETVPAEPAEAKPAEEPKAQNTGAVIAKNLLNQIPGEATGFYLTALTLFQRQPSVTELGILFGLSLIILVLVRRIAKATRAVMFTSIVAFVLWMTVFDQGFIHAAFPAVPPPWGPVGILIYTTGVTLAASAGLIRSAGDA